MTYEAGDLDPLEMSQLRHQLALLEQENTKLREEALATPALQDAQDADPAKLKSSLIRAQRDLVRGAVAGEWHELIRISLGGWTAFLKGAMTFACCLPEYHAWSSPEVS